MSLITRFFQWFSNNNNSNNTNDDGINENNNINDNDSISIRSSEITFESLIELYPSIGNYLYLPEFLGFMNIFRSKDIRQSIMNGRKTIRYPYYIDHDNDFIILTRKNLLQSKSLEYLSLDLARVKDRIHTHNKSLSEDHYYTILRDFQFAMSFGVFTKLKELVITFLPFKFSDIDATIMRTSFVNDFVYTLKSNGFSQLQKLEFVFQLYLLSDKTIQILIDSISRHCLLLEYLRLPLKDIGAKKLQVQTAIFQNNWPKLRTIDQHFLQVDEEDNHALRNTILNALSSQKFPSLDRLVFRECSTDEIARVSLVLPESMDQIKHLTIIGRALRNPLLNANTDKNRTKFCGLVELDISSLEFSASPYYGGQNINNNNSLFVLRTELCHKKLCSSISLSKIKTLKVGYSMLRRTTKYADAVLKSIGNDLINFELIGINSITYFNKHEALVELRDNLSGGYLYVPRIPRQYHNDYNHYSDFDACEHDDEEEYNIDFDAGKAIMAKNAMLLLQKNTSLHSSLKFLKLGSWLGFDWNYVGRDTIDDDEFRPVYEKFVNFDFIDDLKLYKNDMLGKVIDLQEQYYELPNGGEWDLIRDGLLEIERQRWAAVLKQFHNLQHLEMIGIFWCHIKKIESLIDYMICDRHLSSNLLKISFRTYRKDDIFNRSRKERKTLDNYFIKPINQKTTPLVLEYINYEYPVFSETILKFDIPRCVIASKVQDWTLCSICKKNEKSVVLYPCSHMSLCYSCSINNHLKKCPMCNSTIACRSKVKCRHVKSTIEEHFRSIK